MSYKETIRGFTYWFKDGDNGSWNHWSSRSDGGPRMLHRVDDLPAVIDPDGSKHWYWGGQRHREDDKPAIEWASGRKEWWKYDSRGGRADKNAPWVIDADGTDLSHEYDSRRAKPSWNVPHVPVLWGYNRSLPHRVPITGRWNK